MSTDFSIRPVGTPAPLPVVQPQSQAASGAVATQLPASQSVTAADGSANVQNEQQNAALGDTTRQAYFDRDAATIVYQTVNSTTDQVVEQYPDEAVLRRRAYFHALDIAKESGPRLIPTDLTA
jgi:predicted exporter